MNQSIKKLVDLSENVEVKQTLVETKNLERKFEIYFSSNYIKKNYTLKDIKNKDDKVKFITLISTMLEKNWSEIESCYQRKTDKSINYNGKQVYHYGRDNDALRIHGYIDNQILVVTMIDPNHRING